MLSYILYQSKRNPICTDEEITKILHACERNNSHQDITGMLIYSDDSFMQILEGDYKKINDLYQKIKKDPRHSQIISISLGMLKKRFFPSWAMAHKEVGNEHLTIISTMANEEKDKYNDLLSQEASGENSRALGYFRKVAS